MNKKGEQLSSPVGGRFGLVCPFIQTFKTPILNAVADIWICVFDVRRKLVFISPIYMFCDRAGDNFSRLIERSIGIEFVVVVALNGFHRRHKFAHIEALQKSLQDVQTVGGNGVESDGVVHSSISCCCLVHIIV